MSHSSANNQSHRRGCSPKMVATAVRYLHNLALKHRWASASGGQWKSEFLGQLRQRDGHCVTSTSMYSIRGKNLSEYEKKLDEYWEHIL